MLLDDKEVRKILSKNIKSARLSSHLTQEKLAELSEISLDFLKDLERRRSGTSLITLINICHALNITPNDLLKDFFQESYNKAEDIINQIKLLNDYEQNAIYTLIQYFKDNKMNK